MSKGETMAEPNAKVLTHGKVFDGKGIVASIGILVGIGGLALNLTTYASERPNLAVRIESVALRSEANISSLPEQLAHIEEKHGHFTADKIDNLRKLALGATDPSAKPKLEELAENVQETITFFDAQAGKKSELAPQEIVLSGTTLTWPDGTNLDLRAPDASHVLPPNLVEDVRKDPSNASATAAMKEAAYRVYGSEHDPAESRAVAEDLRRIRTSIRDSIDGFDKKVVVRITVENRSKVPTFIQSSAMIRVLQDQSRFADIILSLNNPGFIEGYSIKTFELSSKRTATLKEEDRAYLDSAVSRQDKCLLLLQDLHGKFWSAAGHVADSNALDIRSFVDELDRLRALV